MEIKMDHANNAKINKMLEAAIACAAQDGLSNEEMEQIGGIFKTVVSIGKDIQVIFAEHGAFTEMDGWKEDEVDFSFESIRDVLNEFATNVLFKPETYEQITVDDKYAGEVAEALGNSITLQILCRSIAVAISAADGDIINAEHEAIQALTKKFHPQIKELNPLMLAICSAIEKAAAEDDQQFELTLNLK